jgi:hypothetical protein
VNDDAIPFRTIDPLDVVIGEPIEQRVRRRARESTMADRNYLSLDDVAEVTGQVIKSERKKILEHVNRLHELGKIGLKGAEMREEKLRARVWNMHTRITELENEVKRLRKALPR